MKRVAMVFLGMPLEKLKDDCARDHIPEIVWLNLTHQSLHRLECIIYILYFIHGVSGDVDFFSGRQECIFAYVLSLLRYEF